MMKKYTRTSAESYVVGDNYKRQVIVKHFKDEEGLEHEFTTFGDDYAKSVHVIAFTKDNKVVLVNQFRSGPERWLYDFPGGLMEKREIPLEAALRELGEETGYIPGHIDNIGNFPVDGYTNFTVEVFLATDCVFVEERL